MATRPTPHN